MEYAFLGWPAATPTIDLDHERFAYAGKFVVPTTAKAVMRADGAIVGAIAFDEDRTDPTTIRLRYVTVATEHRGEGIGPRLVECTRRVVDERDYDRLVIAVNNGYAYEALAKVGFAFTGTTTGIAELELAKSVADPPTRIDPAPYRAGLETLLERTDGEEAAFLESRLDRGPPAPIAPPDCTGY